MNAERVETLMLAGGLGRRLEPITGGNRPKCFVELQHNHTAVEYILDQLEKFGIEATWSADNYYYQYEGVLKSTHHRLLWQKPGGIVEAVIQPGGTVLAIAPDCVFPYKDLPKMIEKHIPGTITWAVTTHLNPSTDAYFGMDVSESGAIIGRNNTNIVRAPVTIIDVDLLRQFSRKSSSVGEGENLYFDALVRIEQENRKRINIGKSSIFNAYFLSGPVIDFGSPERYLELQKNLDKIFDKTN